MLEALDRPFRLIAHQCDPSPAVPIRYIVRIYLEGILNQRVRPIILPTGIANDRSGSPEDIAIVWCELARALSELHGFILLG